MPAQEKGLDAHKRLFEKADATKDEMTLGVCVDEAGPFSLVCCQQPPPYDDARRTDHLIHCTWEGEQFTGGLHVT